MAIVKKYNELLDLDEIDVLIDEVDKSRHIILSDIPDSLPQGKSSFLIETSPFMKDGTELQMDFIDSDGASIYLEPVSEYLEGTARRVSAEIYEDTAPGIATLIIVGELESVPEDSTIFSDVDIVPVEYQGAYNVRLTKQIVINPTAVNTEIIKFWDQPKITVFEQRKGTMTRSEITGSIYSPVFDVEGIPTDVDLLFKPYGGIDSDIQQGDVGGGVSSPKKQRNVKAYIESKKRKNRKGLRKNSAFKRSGLLSKTNSPATFPYQLKIGEYNGNESFRFNTGHIGGTVEFQVSNIGNTFGSSSFYPTNTMEEAGLLETPTFDTLKEQGITNVSSSNYTASIVDLINDKTAVVELPFTNKNNNNENIILPIFAKAKIAYENMPTGSYAVANIVSYADVRLANMKTFSGDVYKSKVYVKSEGGFDDYKLLAEVPLEGKELLVDDASVGMGERTGYVIMQSEIDSYWNLTAGTNGVSAVSGDAVATYDNSVMLDSIHLSGSVGETNKSIKLQLKDEYKFNLIKGTDYSISFNAIGEREVSADASIVKDAVLLVYLSGSSMIQKDALYYDEANNINIEEPSQYGKRIGALRVSPQDDLTLDFGSVNQPFAVDSTGDAVLQFRVISGKWNIGDISVQPSANTGFSPSFFQFTQQMPSELGHKRPDTFEFLAEFYDINNNIADTVAYNPSTVFTGANLTITGEDNVLESNLFIGGETTASGIHLGGVSSTVPETGGAGAAGSGFMRTVGYQGFKSASDAGLGGKYGFMFWSGSVLPDSGDNYDGVGLELVGPGGSFTFKTNPSVFDVRADAFFVGKTTTQFLSGSNENIEISSSGFHLSPEGNVTSSAILIGKKSNNTFLQFTDNKLTVEAESFFVGNSTSQFISGSNNNIEVSSSEFHLTPQGNVTASAILLGDKANAQFLQFNNGQLTVQGNISVDSIRTPALIEGSPSTALNASSSIDPNGLARFTSASIAGFTVNTEEIKSTDNSLRLKQIGQITGSKVLFTGGEIGGFTISSTQLSGGDDSDFIGLTPGTGIQMGDSTFSDAPFSVTNAGALKATSGTIAGWNLSGQQITGGQLVLDKGGFIKSADYISDISGFIITAQENGYAEFENCRIRGTLATTTFEKESVNAVGGQMFIANSAALSGSNVNASEVSMSLANVTGFTRGEILLIKKVGNTGFNTEYAKVISSSRTSDGGDSDPDGLAGELYVQRGHGFYTRSVRDFVFNSGGSGTQRTITNGTVYPLNYVNVGQSYSSGDVNGFDVSSGVTHTGSFHIYVTGSIGLAGDGTAVDFKLLNNSNSDSLIGTRRLWEASDGSNFQVQSDLYFSVNDLTPMPTSSKIKAQLVVSTDGTNDAHIYLTKFTASLDYGIVGSIELGESGSVGDPIGGPQDYKEGQVVVSTGRYISGTGSNTVGSGYIRLNANPKNAATPYMDIVERTGSGIYDVELKTRVGDLSGVAGTRNVPENFTGFGIMSEVAFLSGSNIKLEAPTFVLGDLNSAFVSGSSSNIEISSSKFHLQNDGQLIFGNKSTSQYIEWDNSNLTVRGDLSVDNIRTPSTINGSASTEGNASASISSTGNAIFKSGSIAGFEFTNSSISKNSMLLQSDGNITLGTSDDVVRLSASDTTYRLWVGNATAGSAPFRVDKDGNFTATSATITGEINANAGNFTGNISSGATITGGTIRTADETAGSGRSVKLNGTDNTLEFFGDAVAFNSSATDIPTKLFFLDDSNQLKEGNNYSNFPGIGFIGFDANTSTYDGATDGGSSAAHNDGGLYIPYTFGQTYTSFNTMYTGHAIGLYRGSLGQQKLSDGGNYGQDTPEVYDIAQLSLIQTNASPSSPHNQDGNPSGYGGTSTYGAGSNNLMMGLQMDNVISRSNTKTHSTGIKKACRAVSSGNAIRHPGASGGGYNYFKNYELVGSDLGNRAFSQFTNGFGESKYNQRCQSTSNSTNTIEKTNGPTDVTVNYDASWGTSHIDPSNGGSGHPQISNGVVVSPANNSNVNFTKVEYIGYRIVVTDSSTNGNPSQDNVTLTLKARWDSSNGTVIRDIVLYNNAAIAGITSGGPDNDGIYYGSVDLRKQDTWAPQKGSDPTFYLKLTGPSGRTLSIDTQTGASYNNSNSSYVYFYGQGDENSRIEDTDIYGTRIGQYVSGSGITTYGTKYDGRYGDSHYGSYVRIRSSNTTYGIYSRVSETGLDNHIKDSQNGVGGGNVYAGYFMGNLHVQGNITYSGTNSQSSDKRLKENIRIVSGSLDIIKQLVPKRFDWKENYEYEVGHHLEGKKNDIGFIAQDVENVAPELVQEDSLTKRGFEIDLLNTEHTDYKGKTEKDFKKSFKFLNYEKMIPFLVNGMQEQQEQIEKLTKRIKELENK